MKATMMGAVAALAVVAASSSAQVSISQDGRPERMASIKLVMGLNKADHKMVQTLYYGNAFEIMASQIAENRAQSEWGKQYAKEMVIEHTMAQNELKMLAGDKGLTLNNDLPWAMQRRLSALRNTPMSNFDAKYKAVIMSSHAQASIILQQAIKWGHDEQVRNLAIKILPAVKMHYALASVGKTMMGATKADHGM